MILPIIDNDYNIFKILAMVYALVKCVIIVMHGREVVLSLWEWDTVSYGFFAAFQIVNYHVTCFYYSM